MQRDRGRRLRRLAFAAAALVAATAWAGPTEVKCGPARAGCGPAIVTGAATVTTTTLPSGVLPSWVPSMLAAWMLDEASGTRVNLQGTTSRNLVEAGGTMANDTTNKMEGTAAALGTVGLSLQTSDAILKALMPPFTCGFWSRKTVSGSQLVMDDFGGGGGNGFQISHNSDQAWQYALAGSSSVYFGGNLGPNVWAHIAVKQVGTAMQTYRDGKTSSSGMGTLTTSTASNFVVSSGLTGQTDEVWCIAAGLTDPAICRICSCGIRGEQCTCSGTAFASTGRNATACGACALPSDCTIADPTLVVTTTTTIPPAAYTFFDDTATPSGLTTASTTGVTTGAFVTAPTTGSIVAIQFYKAASDTGTHIGAVWQTSNQNVLGQVTFTGETASGWQTMPFSAPIVVSAGQNVTIGVWHPANHSYTALGSPVTGGPWTLGTSSPWGAPSQPPVYPGQGTDTNRSSTVDIQFNSP